MNITFYLHKMTAEETAKQLLADITLWANRKYDEACFLTRDVLLTRKEQNKYFGEAAAYKAMIDFINSVEVK